MVAKKMDEYINGTMIWLFWSLAYPHVGGWKDATLNMSDWTDAIRASTGAFGARIDTCRVIEAESQVVAGVRHRVTMRCDEHTLCGMMYEDLTQQKHADVSVGLCE